MSSLLSDDLRIFSQVLQDLYAIADLDRFPAAAMRLVRMLVSGDQVSYTEINLPHHFVFMVDPPSPIAPHRMAALKAHIVEHPLYKQHEKGDQSVHKISDFLTPHELHRLSLYQRSMHLAGIEYQISVALPAQLPLHVSISVSRCSSDFSERDRLLLDLLAPHLGRARDTAEWLTLARRMDTNRALVIADHEHKIQFASDSAQAWLADYFGAEPFEPGLPSQVREWADTHLDRLRKNQIVEGPSEPIVVRQGSRSLALSFMSKCRAGNQYAILLEQRVDPVPAAMGELKLRPRESDVLSLVLKGKSDPEIAKALSLSVRTVEKHLENIYDRLNVNNRTAAVARALDLITAIKQL